MIKISIAQIELVCANPKINTEKMLLYIEKAKKENIDLIVFPELSISGSMNGDLLFYRDFLKECELCGKKIIRASKDITVIFGNIAIDWKKKNTDGSIRKYNACFVAQNKRLIKNSHLYDFSIKAELSDASYKNESRYYTDIVKLAYENNTSPNTLIKPFTINLKNQKVSVGCTIGETYKNNFINHFEVLYNNKIDFFINISSKPFSLSHNKQLLSSKDIVNQYKSPFIYVNNIGMQNNGKNIYAYRGGSHFLNRRGKLIEYTNDYTEEIITTIYSKKENDFISKKDFKINDFDEITNIYKAIKYSTQKFLRSCYITKMVIGLSGGIDSAVAAALYADILGHENIILVNMPSKFNSKETIDISRSIAKNLNSQYLEIPICDSINLTKQQLDDVGKINKNIILSDFAMENIQARDRYSRILAAISASYKGSAFSCNTNKSELTIGYGTFYGDLAGIVAILGDLWKYQVYALGRYLNSEIFKKEIIPEKTFTIKPSAELSSKQTIGIGGDPLFYEYHDFLFKSFVEDYATPLDIAKHYEKGTLEKKLGIEKNTISKLFNSDNDFFVDLEKWWNLLNGFAIAKRIQSPPIISISTKPFGSEKKEGQNPAFSSNNYNLLKLPK